jgi:hypothetical protein
MSKRKHLFAAGFLLALTFAFAAPQASFAKPSEYDKVVKHLKTKYQAKKVSLGFVWLARLAVKVVRPAGVKSFNVTLFKDLQFSRDTVDVEMQEALRQSFGPEWTSVFRARSRDGQQAYMYMREDGSNVKLTVVTIDKQNAAVVRAKFSPEKLADFINDPRIFGISLSDGDKPTPSEDPPVMQSSN